MEFFAGGTPTRAGARRRGPRPAGLPDQPRRPRRTGSTPRPSSWPAIDAHTPDPADGRIEREPDGDPGRHPARGRGRPRRPAASVGQPREDMHAGLLAAQELLFSLGHHRPGRTPRSARCSALDDILPTYLAAAALRRRSRPGSSARCGGTATAAREQIAELVRASRATARSGRFAATSVKIMQDGVAENFTAAMLEPYLDDHGCAHRTTPGLSFVDPIALRDHVTELDAARLPGALPRPRRPRGPRGARRASRRPARPTARPTAATTSPTCRSCTPTTCRGSPQLGAVANIQPLWAAHEPQMDELTIPFLGAERARRGSTRSATCCGPAHGWRPAATGRSAARTRRRASTSR